MKLDEVGGDRQPRVGGHLPNRARQPIPLEEYAFRLPMHRRRIVLRAEEDLHFPKFRGAVWHSLLGPAIKELACTVPPGVCAGCPRRSACEYPRLMEPEAAETSAGPVRPGARVPGPLVLDTGPWSPLRIQAGELFSFDFAVVAADRHLTATVERAVALAAARGLRRRRAVASVVCMEPRPGLEEILPALTRRNVGAVRLHLISPLRLRQKGALVRRFDPGALVRNLAWRLAALGHYHAGLPWPEPWREVLEQASRARVVGAHTRWVEAVRYSARQGREIVTGGLVGEALMDGAGGELAMLLGCASVLHAGKGASMGLGQLEVDPQHSVEPGASELRVALGGGPYHG